MKSEPLVSVVMNCYNGEKYLNEAIDSIYNQNYNNWEIIFWDNNSQDKSAKIANSYNSKIKYFKGNKTIPLGAARNKAIEQCKGEFITFLDSDDIWLPDKLSIQICKMQDYQESILCYTDGFNLYEDYKSIKKITAHKNVNFFEGFIFDKLIISNFINWQSVMINKNLAADNLFFNEKLTYSEDHEILLRLSLIGEITACKVPLIYYRIHDNNMSRDYKLIISETEKIYKLFNDHIIAKKININIGRALLYGSIAIKLIQQKNVDYNNMARYLIKYSNFQNITVYFIIKLKLTGLLRMYLRLIS